MACMNEQLLSEILGDAELYHESLVGSDGPWVCEALVIDTKPEPDRICVFDIRGEPCNVFFPNNFPEGEARYDKLRTELYKLNEKVLEDL